MPLHGVDISGDDADTYRPRSEDVFVFVKATEGHTVHNPYHDEQVERSRRAGQVVGHYHWIWPGDLDAQLAYFANYAKVQPGDLVALDWENPRPPVPGTEKDAFLRLLKKTYPNNRVLLYCSPSYWREHNTTGYVADGLWIAHWDVPKPKIDAPYLFWQYATKPWDQDWGYFDDANALRRWALGDEAADEHHDNHPKGGNCLIYRNNTTWQQVPAGEGGTLNIDDPDQQTGKSKVSLVVGATPSVDLVSTVQLDGLPPGQTADVYFVRVQCDKDGKTTIDRQYRDPGQVMIVGRSDGRPASAEVSLKDTVGRGDPQFRIRVHIDTPVPVRARMLSRGWVGPQKS